MANLRPVLIVGLFVLAYMIWIEWQKDYGPRPQDPAPTSTSGLPAAQAPSTADIPGAADIPAVRQTTGTPSLPEATQGAETVEWVTVTTDVLEVRLDPRGATAAEARLLQYPVDLEQPETKFTLLSADPARLFLAQSGLLSHQDAPNHNSTFGTDKREWRLDSGQESLQVPFTWRSDSGVEVTKTYVFRRGDYVIDVSLEVTNNSPENWAGSRYDQLQRTVAGDEDSGGFTNPESYSFFGIGFYNPEDKFEKIAFDDVDGENYKRTTREGWLAMIQHYFFGAWIPPIDDETTYTALSVSEAGSWPRYIARAVSPSQQVAPGGSAEFSGRLYVGPKLQDNLPDIAPGLEYTVNYGIFTVFSKPLFWLLDKIHAFTGNWGWAIVLLTVLIKLAFFKLTEAQYRSTARMRKLQPRIEQLKERYGDDRQRMSQAMMEMYKKEKVNPLGGCLPILVQIPIFIALYWVLLESVELRQAPFILWIDNLSVRDPYFILPLLNAAFMFATQKLTPMVGMDPLQQKMMQMMPLIFSVMFAFFPAGLVLYWATNAGLSLAQQYYITRKIAAAD
jgi:YidC/Oxa1 family membrane protein insertase